MKSFKSTNSYWNILSYVIFIVLTIGFLSCGEKPKNEPGEQKIEPANKTLENLMTAFNGESNATNKYTLFAKKADEEGYTQVASLFRAASRSEQIHAEKHALAITKMGGTPKADIKQPEVKTTADNLKNAIEGETYEKDKMYPEFLEQAKADKNTDAIRSINAALEAEKKHAEFYTEALNNIEQWKTGKMNFYVCTVCGYTVKKVDFEKCTVCFSPKDKFLTIN